MTDNPKHTPGPWQRSETMIHGSDGAYVARLQRGTIKPDVVRANGLLIIAAPDLLEELKMAEARLDFLTNWLEFTYHGAPADVRNGRAYAAAARAAISRAEGSQK